MTNSITYTPDYATRQHDKQILLSAIRLGLPVILVVAASLFYLLQQEIASQRSVLERRQISLIEFAGKSLELELNSVAQNLINLSIHLEVRDYLTTWAPKRKKALQQEFHSFIENNRQYDQARLLLMNGHENIRINKEAHGAYIVPDDQLQDKGSRYYFTETKDLPSEAIYFSPLDLNIEHGTIEIPLKPTIRFATGADDSLGVRQGVIVLNYLADDMLHSLAELDRNERTGLMLLNKDGYWLYHKDKEKCWGFMYPDRQNLTFQAEFPDAWEDISATSKGQMYVNGDLITYAAINYIPPSNLSHNLTHSLSWRLVGMIPRSELAALARQTYMHFFYLFGVLTSLISVIAFTQAKRMTEKRASEKELLTSRNRFRQIVEGSWDIVWEVDINGNFTYVSPRIWNILGYTQDEAKADPPFNLTPLLRHTFFHNPSTMDVSHVHWEETCMHKDGYPVWVRSTGTAFFDEQGQVAGYRGITRDITDSVKNKQDLETARNFAEQANSAKSEFLARMSHEIRTPMNAIVGLGNLALRKEHDPRQRDYLMKIKHASDTLLNIINDILDFSKIEAGKIEIERHPFALNTLLENVINIVVLAAEEKGIELLLSVGSDVPASLYGDSLRLSQVLTNLANNAVKFTEEGEVTLSVRGVKQDKQNATLRFSVRDSGIGMSEENMKDLYSPFTQADGSTTRLYGGTGLGLSISKRLVDLMGGDLQCESRLGLGTEFHFTLTMEISEFVKQTFRMPESILGCKVLAVDDNPNALQVLAESLESFGLKVDTTISPSHAIPMVEKADPPYDVVFMDWKMPEMDGITCIREIRKQLTPQNDPKFIMVTAYGRDEIRQRLAEENISALMLKPINRSLLFNTLLEAFNCDFDQAITNICKQESAIPNHIRGARILLAEDNELNQQVASELLQGADIDVTIARNGEEALALVQKQEFQAVLMDIQMPVMDGLEATRKIRSIPRLQGMPIIAMTAHAMVSDRNLSLQSGMNDHVNKPINPDELYATLGKWIHKGGWEPVATYVPAAPPPMPDFAHDDVIDVTAGMRRVRNNKTIYANLLRGFMREQTDIAGRISQCLKQENSDAAFRLAHTLKGVAGNIGAMTVYETAEQVCQALRENSPNPQDTVNSLEKAMEQVANSIPRITRTLMQESSDTASEAQTGTADEQAAPHLEAATEPIENMEERLHELQEAITIHDMAALALFESLAPALARIDTGLAIELGEDLTSFAFKKAAIRVERLSELFRKTNDKLIQQEERS
ncbi:MAG: response regulator [Halodesulfovibrio sp.]